MGDLAEGLFIKCFGRKAVDRRKEAKTSVNPSTECPCRSCKSSGNYQQ